MYKFSGSYDSSIFGYGAPQEIGGPRVLETRQGRDPGEWPRVRKLFPHGEFARGGSAGAGGYGDNGQVRPADSGQRRRHRRSGGGGPSGNLQGSGGVQRRTAGAVEEARLPDSRPARARTQEVRPKGRAQTVPVLQALINPRRNRIIYLVVRFQR